MADKSHELLLTALSQAFAHADGLPVHGTKTMPGLFPGTATGKQAAQRSCTDGYLERFYPLEPQEPTSKKAKSAPKEHAAITEKGISFLLEQVSPRQVLEDLVRVLEQRQEAMHEWIVRTREMEKDVSMVRLNVCKVLDAIRQASTTQPSEGADPLKRMSTRFYEFMHGKSPASRSNGHEASNGGATVPMQTMIVRYLQNWRAMQKWEDCPLPELYQHLQQSMPQLTVGEFHDQLRAMQASNAVYLHPWTGPMYELPQPSFALMVGHEIAYYASIRE